MVKENLGAEAGSPRWFIDLDWCEQNGRSFLILAQGCLCPRCREQLKTGEISAAKLVATVRDCCSKLPGFITGELPILTIIFRLFLANGNEPLNLAELGRRLGEWWGGGTYPPSAEFLSRLLKDEWYYGIRRVLI
jgi:hypothetical protein